MPAHLVITDGTATINLLKPQGSFGFHLEEWRPAIPDYKRGGTWQDSPLAQGRRLAQKRSENAIETFRLKAHETNQDQLIRDLQDLRRLLEKASSYWVTGWQDEPVWIEARASGETNTRYAWIYRGSMLVDGNPFNQPFMQADCSAVMDKLSLIVEHSSWSELEPGTGGAVETSAMEEFDGRMLGNVDEMEAREPTSEDAVFVANKRNMANITDVYYWDSVLGVWSVNLMDRTPPYNLLPATPAAGDFVLFGIDTSLANSGPFASLVFDLIPQDDLEITWRYSDAGVLPTGWTALNVTDGTNAAGAHTGEPFDTAGVNSVHWWQEPVVAWVDTITPAVGGVAVPGGIAGFWVCAHVTAVGAAPTAPQQQNRDVYSVIWPYIEIQEGQVLGDIPSLLRMRVHNRSAGQDLDVRITSDNVYMGLRSMSRGEDFTAYINLCNEQNPAGISVAPQGTSGQVAYMDAATGLAIQFPGGVQAFTEECRIQLDNTLTDHFSGVFHMYLRAAQTGGTAGDIRARVVTRLGHIASPVRYTSPWDDTKILNLPAILDMGHVRIPPAGVLSSDTSQTIYFMIEIADTVGAGTLTMFDLILLPVDEWAGEFPRPGTTGWDLDYRVYLDVNSLTPKFDLHAPVRWLADDELISVHQTIAVGPAMLQANAKQRLWFLASDAYGGEDRWLAIETVHSTQTTSNDQYLSMRGNR